MGSVATPEPDLLTVLLHARDARAVRAGIRRHPADPELHELAAAMARALGGDEPAVREYVEGYRALTRTALRAARHTFPKLVVETPGVIAVLDASGQPSPAMAAVLEAGAVQAPFSAWVSAFGAPDGLALDVVARLRTALRGVAPLPLPAGASALPHWDVDDGAVLRFVQAVRTELDAPDSPLDAIAAAFDLNETELAALFGVRRQAIGQWRSAGVPAARQEKLATVAAIADLLSRHLKAARLPGIARRRAPAYGERTMLEAIAADRHRELLDSVRASFDWARSA